MGPFHPAAMDRKRKIDLGESAGGKRLEVGTKDGMAEGGDPAVNPLTYQPYSQRYYDILEGRKGLPIWQARSELVRMLSEHQTTVLVGETGSGKTTQVAQFICDAGYCAFDDQTGQTTKMVGCTQPRRVAAMSVAKRVSEEMDVSLGEQVGYTIRFEDVSGPSTCIRLID